MTCPDCREMAKTIRRLEREIAILHASEHAELYALRMRVMAGDNPPPCAPPKKVRKLS